MKKYVDKSWLLSREELDNYISSLVFEINSLREQNKEMKELITKMRGTIEYS